MRGWEKIFHTNGNDKNARVAILRWDTGDFKIKAVKKDKEGHYVMIKGSIHGEDVILVNIYASNMGAHKYIKQILTDIKGETDGNTIIWGGLNIPTHINEQIF